MRSARRCPLRLSAVKTYAISPRRESFASRTASSSSRTFMIGMTGPKISFCMTSISCRQSVSTVGCEGPAPCRRAACRRCARLAPSATARAMRSSTISICRSQVIDRVGSCSGRPAAAPRRPRRSARPARRAPPDARTRARPRRRPGPGWRMRPTRAPRAVRSRSASAQTIAGALPPSSSAHGISRSPHAAPTLLARRRRAREDAVVDAAVDERRAGRAAPGDHLEQLGRASPRRRRAPWP